MKTNGKENSFLAFYRAEKVIKEKATKRPKPTQEVRADHLAGFFYRLGAPTMYAAKQIALETIIAGDKEQKHKLWLKKTCGGRFLKDDNGNRIKA